jgi:hypothetical protein
MYWPSGKMLATTVAIVTAVLPLRTSTPPPSLLQPLPLLPASGAAAVFTAITTTTTGVSTAVYAAS